MAGSDNDDLVLVCDILAMNILLTALDVIYSKQLKMSGSGKAIPPQVLFL